MNERNLPPGPGQHQGGETYVIELRALRSKVPPINRLRHVLKALLRTYEFRAVSVRETTPPARPVGNVRGPGKDGTGTTATGIDS